MSEAEKGRQQTRLDVVAKVRLVAGDATFDVGDRLGTVTLAEGVSLGYLARAVSDGVAGAAKDGPAAAGGQSTPADAGEQPERSKDESAAVDDQSTPA